MSAEKDAAPSPQRADSDTTPTDGSPESADQPSPGKAFGHTYWMLNSIEAFERLAFFGIRAVVPIYIMQATEPGGLHLTAIHKGWIYMWWAVLQSWLPMFTGGIADRYGYKRVLVGAISANVIGYFMMASFHDYYGFFAGILVLATGTAFFKPALQGSIAQNLTKENSSMGWGIFYWVVNVGAVGAPLLATVILGKPHSAEGWRNLFIASGLYTCVNLLLLLTFRDVPSGADKTQRLVKVFALTIENIWPFWFQGGRLHPLRGPLGIAVSIVGLGLVILTDWWHVGLGLFLGGGLLATWLLGGRFVWQLRLPAFLAIMSCFWMMMYQLWDLHPNFIEDWIDSSMVAAHAPDFWTEYGDRGLIRVPQQILLNLNAALIVFLIVPISWLVRKMRTLSAMLIGMTVATIGILVAGLTGNGWFFLLGVVFFSLGEMLTGPKKNQYLGLIAPPGKKGLYLGYVNIPIGIGVGFGSMIAGIMYDNYGEKATLALKHLGANPQLVARAAQSADWSDTLEKIPELTGIDRSEAFNLACQDLGQEPSVAAETLRQAFRHDHGQIVNLGLQYLSLHDEFRERATAGLAELLQAVEDDAELQRLGDDLGTGKVKLEDVGVARFVHHLPEALQIKRPEVLEIISDRVNAELEEPQRKQEAQITDMLWAQFENDAELLNNLSLEYLAQHTSLLFDALAGVTFEDPVKEMEPRVGIGRTKSFGALSVALGASESEVNAALDQVNVPAGAAADRAFVYLTALPHHRFIAVAQKDWANDVDLLQAMIEGDADAQSAARKALNGEVDYNRLAEEQEYVQAALAAKDWTKTPDQAARLLGLNPYEARALVAAEVAQSPLTTTKLLWDQYKPQYCVWLPFAAIGVVAIFALAVFGQMAK
ncbi:MAG: peptide MFS transporter, partial [bacterium]|nr:peptide MFS transporter [bacterium]